MKLKVVVPEAEVPAIPGCVAPGETFAELLLNIYSGRKVPIGGRSRGHPLAQGKGVGDCGLKVSH